MNKRILRLACVLMAIQVIAPAATRAQGIPVMDISNIAQTVQVVMNGIQQLNSLSTQIQNQAAQISNQQLMLNGLGGNAYSQVGGLAYQTQSLMAQVANINQMQATFRTTYDPGNPTATLASLQQIQTALQNANMLATQIQSQVQANQPVVSGQVQSAITMSNSATGPTGVGQATNQLLGIQSQQMQDTQNLMMAQQQLDRQKEAAAQSQSAAVAAQAQALLQANPITH